MNVYDPRTGEGRLRALYVEDDEDYFVIVRELLSETEPAIDLHWSASYADGLRDAASSSFDAYLVDHRLGPRDGLDLVRELRDRGYDAPILVVTGNSNPALVTEAIARGADDVLVKDSALATSLGPMIRRTWLARAERRRPAGGA